MEIEGKQKREGKLGKEGEQLERSVKDRVTEGK